MDNIADILKSLSKEITKAQHDLEVMKNQNYDSTSRNYMMMRISMLQREEQDIKSDMKSEMEDILQEVDGE